MLSIERESFMRTVGCLVVVVMSLAAVNAPAKEWKAWIEAEDYAAQSGSQATFYRMEETASEGRIADNDWGRDVGDFLRWSIEIPQRCDPLYVTVKFARAFPDPASIRVRAGNGQALVQFPTTGGWGFEKEQWHYGEIRLEGLSPGRYSETTTLSKWDVWSRDSSRLPDVTANPMEMSSPISTVIGSQACSHAVPSTEM